MELGEKFDTSKVTTMAFMFQETGYSSTIFTLDLGDKFDTSNVTSMFSMFMLTGVCSTTFTLDLGDKFDTSKVINMSNMFNATGYLSPTFTLDLGDKFDTSNVTNMDYMFCYTGTDSKKLNTSNLSECEMYVTLYPCMMCQGAIIESRLKKVYYILKQNKEVNHKINYEQTFVEEKKYFEKEIKSFFKDKR